MTIQRSGRPGGGIQTDDWTVQLTNDNGPCLIDFAAKNMAFVAPFSSTASIIDKSGDHHSIIYVSGDASGNAALWNPTECGVMQTEVGAADPPLPGENAPPGRSGMRGDGTAVPFKKKNRKFYQKLNTSRKRFLPQAKICRDKDGSLLTDKREVIERWKQHFDEHLNVKENIGTGDQSSGENYYVGAAEDGNEPTPTLRKVEDVIHHLKNNKSAGKDGIPAELIKMDPEKLTTCLHRLVVNIWETEQLPEEWKEGIS